MGCFDSNCCLTGLPLHHGDPIRAALIVEGRSARHRGTYVASNWQFMTPPVLSQYNDYGNLTWNLISESERMVLEFVLNMLLPSLEDHKEYSRNFFENKFKNLIPMESIWDHCLHGDIEFDPYRKHRDEYEKWIKDGMQGKVKYPVSHHYPIKLFQGWMCHAWAWDHIHDMLEFEGEEFEKQLTSTFVTNRCVEKLMYEKFPKDADGVFIVNGPEDIREMLKMADWQDFWIFGEQGAFYPELKVLIKRVSNPIFYDTLLDNVDQFKNMFRATVRVVANMIFLRKTITPLTTCGEQYESFEYFGEWTQLVADKVVERIEERRRDYEGDEE